MNYWTELVKMHKCQLLLSSPWDRKVYLLKHRLEHRIFPLQNADSSFPLVPATFLPNLDPVPATSVYRPMSLLELRPENHGVTGGWRREGSGCWPSHVMTNEAEGGRIHEKVRVPEVGWIPGCWFWSWERTRAICVWFLFVHFEIRFHYATQVGLSTQPSCLSLLNAEL